MASKKNSPFRKNIRKTRASRTLPADASRPFGANVAGDILYQHLVEHMNEGVWMGDSRERTVYANPKFCEMVGYELSEIIGKESYIFWDKESAERVRSVNEGHRKKGISSSYEGNLRTRDGEIFPVLLSGTPLPDGGTIGIITDLTELRKKEVRERALNGAVNQASDAIFSFDHRGRVTSWNKGARIVFGYNKEEVMDKKLSMFFSVREMREFLLNTSTVYHFETLGKHKNGTPINISATLTPVGTDGKQTLMIARDITSQKKFEEEMSLRYEKIQEAYNRFGVIRRQMDYIFEMLRTVDDTGTSAMHDRKYIADFIVSSVIMLTRVDACVLRVKRADHDTLDIASFFGLSADWESKAHIQYSGSLAEKAFSMNTPLKILDVSKDRRYQSAYLAKKNNVCSLLLVPLRFRGAMVGSLSLYLRPDRKLELFDNEFLSQYAKLLGMVVHMTFL